MTIPSGALRFNSDSRKLEYYNGEAWWQIDSFTPDSATGGARGVFGGGLSPNTNLSYVTISTTGNSISFGNYIDASNGQSASCASNTRGLFLGGIVAPYSNATITNVIQYITISSTGNAIDFGDISVKSRYGSSCSNSTRGIYVTGDDGTSNYNTIDYVTIATTGNAVDFGDTSRLTLNLSGACSSSTRGAVGSGSPIINAIEYLTIATTGNTLDFGDLSVARSSASGSSSNAIRGLFAGGIVPSVVNIIDYITIATTGNAVDFGDSTRSTTQMTSCSSSTRALFAGGYTAPALLNIIDYVTIMSTGNAIDFGDLISASSYASACSNGHGGL
jgi:hypothetical protein